MSHGIFKFTQFGNCAAQIRKCEIANQFQNRNPISKLCSAIWNFWYSSSVQEASIISDSVLKHFEKNAVPVKTSKVIAKDKGQKMVRPLKSDPVAHCSRFG